MTQLYTTYADLYHKMYQSFIDYDEEYQYYKDLITTHGGANRVLEVGCGTGQLAKRFLRDGYVYTGIDISSTMLEYAKAQVPAQHLHEIDMRDINLDGPFDCVIITARSLSYILTNQDVMATFRSIRKILTEGGLLIFDFINAAHFIPSIRETEVIAHEVVLDGVKYKRESIFEKRIDTSWNWVWKSRFLREGHGTFEEIGNDVAELRSFTSDELRIFLALNGFNVTEIIERKVYAFDTRVLVAR